MHLNTKIDFSQVLLVVPFFMAQLSISGELEVLLEASIRLSRAGFDTKSEPCQRFYREGLLTSFTKVRMYGNLWLSKRIIMLVL